MKSIGPAAPAKPVFDVEMLEERSLFAAAPSVYLLGNSMTDGIRYAGLHDLLARDGAAVTLGRQTGPGYSLAYNLNLKPGYYTSGYDPDQPGNGDPWGNYQQAFASTWDALTVQPAERRLLSDKDPKDLSSTQNQGDVPITLEFMKQFAIHSPDAQVYAYSRPVRRTDIDDNGNSTGITFDYASEWNKPYVESGTGKNSNLITRSYTLQYMSLVRDAQKNDPATAGMLPVRLIPAAEAYYNVDQMIKAGKFAGTYVHSITDFYADRSHPRGDTGSYLIALTFYASLTGNDPRGVAPTSSYVRSNPDASDAKVQSLIQEAVYEAMVYSGYTGLTTFLPDGTPPPPPAPAQTPYKGSPFAVGASAVTIQVEDFDTGGEGVAYHDAEAANLGGKYRTESVDVQPTTDSGGGYNVGYVKAGEWLEYTINVAAAGSYDFSFRTASAGSNATFHVEIDGVDKSGLLTVPKTSGWQSWTTVTRAGVSLSAGQHVLRLAMNANGSTGSVGNFNWMKIAPAGSTPSGVGSISGKLFSDTDKDGALDAGEELLSGRIVFIDLDGDNALDANEKRVTSGAGGVFKFTGLAAGSYKVRRVFPGGYHLSTAPLNVTLSAGENFTGGLIGAAKA